MKATPRPPLFEMKAKHSTWIRQAEATKGEATIIIHQFKGELASVWLCTPTSYTRKAQNMELNEALKLARDLFYTL
jgi:hypothetical protein